MRVTILLILVATMQFFAAAAGAGSPRVQLVQHDGKWELRLDGQPYLIKGVGGSASKQRLAELGGNSFRTWDADDIGAVLDEAHRLGLTVTVGIWLKHERHGFNYNDADFVAGQFEMVRDQVNRYKDHPAVIMWALGNEMEGEPGNNAAIWSHVNSCAALVKQLDPTRPTMTVVAEIGGDKVKYLERLCPNIDVLGINSYAGAASVIDRYLKQGGTKPVVITEFGPVGTWEVPPNPFGALVEPTSTEKAGMYRRHHDATVLHPSGIVLGSYAFTWGAKQEATATWFGMLLADGSKLGSVDAMVEVWTGKHPPNLSPKIEPIQLSTESGIVLPHAEIQASVLCSDPEGDPLEYEWVLQAEVKKRSIGGDHEAVPPIFPDLVRAVAPGRATVKAPAEPGIYRLYVFARDGKGSAATANIPILVSTGSSE